MCYSLQGLQYTPQSSYETLLIIVIEIFFFKYFPLLYFIFSEELYAKVVVF